MAILESRISTGVSWVGESIALFKQSPRKWLLLAAVYVGWFSILSILPQIFGLITILAWPIFIAVAMRMYRNVEVQKQEGLQSIMKIIQPKLRSLIAVGFITLIYFIAVVFIFSADIQEIVPQLQDMEQMNEQERVATVRLMIPLMLKLMLLASPLMVATWFAPMLIAFNNYTLMKAIKSSIAGVLQHMVAMGTAWLLLTVGMITLFMFCSIFAGAAAAISPAFSQFLGTITAFGYVLLSTALMLAFQYVSYRDVFRAA